jgi:acyl carrier protein
VITLARVSELIQEQLRGKLGDDLEITAETKLADLGLSSLQVSEVVFSLEEQLDAEFDSAQAADVQTVGDVVALANAVAAGDAPIDAQAV